ncbi:MAG: thymidine phosphorylase [Blastocatellia bacterium]|nr:thymidine phosphorylase [Blastocatellia bacterium]MCS7157363.1 thymidine phosphorylase [Blastocatellia bacterium]MCX7753229.1 thymidine phosphorylase [Blastocatellia bacterium]MDW8168268.1 thymidine phosphorylase [Acidobacteriota bacterium]MDW8255439.1 thymidine phosphorylase [Acidobacteriota bacterium]
MRVVDLIRKKRDGQALAPEEIAFLIRGYSRGEIPDYQMAAFLMATMWRGMTMEETLVLTEEMVRSGRTLDWGHLLEAKVDKHSTGGVGDKTSLVLAPIVAAAGGRVPMISGRGLAHTGGTLDKLESIPGFRVQLPLETIRQLVERVGAALVGQTEEIVPADRKLYALRDVTATVECVPLIVASIMSKKIAEGIDALVLDVKVGKGAFMKSEDEARDLAERLVDVGRRMGKRVRALLTDMNQPLGRAVGNALEVIESIETLKGRGPEDLRALSLELAAHMLLLSDRAANLDTARQMAERVLHSGAALEKFREIVEAQGGDPRVVDDYARLPQARFRMDYRAEVAGVVVEAHAERLGQASMLLGAGREHLHAPIDHAVGLIIHKKVGEPVIRGEVLCTLHYNSEERLPRALEQVRAAFVIGAAAPKPEPLIKAVV